MLTHVFLDISDIRGLRIQLEQGQAKVPDCLVPMTTLLRARMHAAFRFRWMDRRRPESRHGAIKEGYVVVVVYRGRGRTACTVGGN
jgi:hypothetical protein